MAGGVWSERDTTPGAIEAALRELITEQCARHDAYAPARVLNLVVIVDREWRGEIMNRLDRVGRYHPSRTILCAVESGRTTIDATVVWSPHGHPEAVDALLHLAQVVLVDSVNEPDSAAAVARARELAREAYVVDLAWLRSTPWRERVAATFDPAAWRDELGRIDSVVVRHQPQSAIAGLLFCGWLASRLGWEPGSLVAANGSLRGQAHGRRQDVRIELVSDPTMSVPGLAGIEIGTASGMRISLDRGPGGLSARRSDRKGRESAWTVLGASRGEAGILGEGIRQALLRDPAYRRALDQAEAMVS